MKTRGFVAVMLAVAVGAGCSSSAASRAGEASTTTRAPVAPATAPTPSPRESAIALAHRLLGEAVLPPGARRTDAPLPQMLRGPWNVPAGDGVVTAGRAYSVSDPPADVLSFLRRHPARGLVAMGTGSVSSPTERVDYVTDELVPPPPNISQAGIEIGVQSQGNGSLVNVVAGAQWTPVRPATELVGSGDGTVIITARYAYRPGAPVIRRAVITGEPAANIVRAFNALRVAPSGVVHGCPALGARSVGFEIGFADSATAVPYIVASLGPCGGVAVTLHGKRATGLTPSSELDAAIAHALGVSELHFVR